MPKNKDERIQDAIAKNGAMIRILLYESLLEALEEAFKDDKKNFPRIAKMRDWHDKVKALAEDGLTRSVGAYRTFETTLAHTFTIRDKYALTDGVMSILQLYAWLHTVLWCTFTIHTGWEKGGGVATYQWVHALELLADKVKRQILATEDNAEEKIKEAEKFSFDMAGYIFEKMPNVKLRKHK